MLDKRKNNITAGNQTTINPNANVIGTYLTNSLTQYNVPSGNGMNLLDDAHVEDAKAWVDENHK